MTYRLTLKKYIVLAAIAFTTATFWFARSSSQPASARIADGSVTFLTSSVLGLPLGQTVRVCIGTTDPRGPVLDWSVRFSDKDGTLLFQSPEERSPARQWRCSSIARSALPLAGDEGTGRAQVAMQVVVKAPAGTKSSEIIGEAEVLTATGQTEVAYQIMMEDVLLSNFNVG